MISKKNDVIRGQTNLNFVDAEKVQKEINDLVNQYSASVFKNYLPYISSAYDVDPYRSNIPHEETVAFFDITKLVIEEKDKMVEKLKNVYHLLAYSDNSLALIIHRKHESCQIGLAVGKCQDSEAATKLAESVQDAIVGNFPGTSCGEVCSYMDSADCVFQALNIDTYFNDNDILNYNSVAVVSNIASQFSEDYINQGIEKVIDGIVPSENKEYTMIVLGESLNSVMLDETKRKLYSTYTGLSPYSKQTENWTLAKSQSWGRSLNAGLAYGVNLGVSQYENDSSSQSAGSSVEINQYSVTHTLEIIEKQMERLEKCEALGIWNIATYVLSSDCRLANEVAHMYMSLTQGNESYYEKPSINVWNSQRNEENRKEVKNLVSYLRYLIHPKLIKRSDIKTEQGKYWPSEVTPTSIVSGAELALAMNFPKKSVPGFSLIECASFGREILSYDQDYVGEVHIGKIHHMHHNEEQGVDLNKDSFSSHAFITGSTGAGKSNAVYTILDSLKTTFMVIEPAKGEYKYALPVMEIVGKPIEDVESASTNGVLNEAIADGEKITEGLWPKIEKQEVCSPLSPSDIGCEAWKKVDIESKIIYTDSPRYVITMNESLENNRHPITGVWFERRVIELQNGERIEGVFPQFESMFDARITEELYSQSDRVHFRECNRQLAQEMENNPALKELFTEEQIEQIRDGIIDGTAPDGCVWHHDAEAGKIQLVDFETHSHTGHTGGRCLWGGGAVNR